MPFVTADLLTIAPEGALILSAMALLLRGVVKGNDASPGITRIATVLMVFLAIALVAPEGKNIVLNGMFYQDAFTVFNKVLLLVGASVALILSLGFYKSEDKSNFYFEYPVLVLFAVAGMFILVSANNLLTLYMGLEMQSFCLYVLASINRDSVRSGEAGMKYFILGALSSGILLYGCSLIYGFIGTTDFTAIAALYHGQGATEGLPIGILIGLILVIIGILFKISAVPFHMWTPDVYEGVPTPVTAFFSFAPKAAVLAFFARLITDPFGGLIHEWQQIIIFVAVASMFVGALGAIKQTNIKRLMAYSSIGHIGYALIALAANGKEGLSSLLIYLAIYLTMTAGTFAIILMMRKQEILSEDISSLSGLSKTHPLAAIGMAIFMFSLAGVPPFAGFFAKFYVLMAAVDKGLYVLAIMGVLASVISAFYYIRIVKVMYFDDVVKPIDTVLAGELKFVATTTALLNLFFFIAPGPLIHMSEKAVNSLIF